MRIFLAGASGAIGRRLLPMLRDAGHSVTGPPATPRAPQHRHERPAARAGSEVAGAFNIADDDGAVSIAKAREQLGFDPSFRCS